MTIPGIARLTLTSKDANGHSYSFDQNLMVKKVDYGYDYQMQVASETIDPKVTEPEDEFLFKTVAPVTATKMWNGTFVPPTSTPTCTTDTYGKLRSFNGSDWIYWHSGIDFCGAVGDKIFAAADGTVIYTGDLDVRGNTTIIDHGKGVYTGYYHQSKIEVTVGEQVKAGQEIGLIGATGRVTGPHLHLDVIVGDVQVNPVEWLNGSIP
jgi:murein DD-endopeptidase MepM/ murein hydrolase activator NlpD